MDPRLATRGFPKGGVGHKKAPPDRRVAGRWHIRLFLRRVFMTVVIFVISGLYMYPDFRAENSPKLLARYSLLLCANSFQPGNPGYSPEITKITTVVKTRR